MPFTILDDGFNYTKGIGTLERAKQIASDVVCHDANDVAIVDELTGFVVTVWTGDIIQGQAQWNDAT